MSSPPYVERGAGTTQSRWSQTGERGQGAGLEAKGRPHNEIVIQKEEPVLNQEVLADVRVAK